MIIFGDHTRRIKFIDFKFAVGADGTKLLHPFKSLSPKFFFYYLRTLPQTLSPVGACGGVFREVDG